MTRILDTGSCNFRNRLKIACGDPFQLPENTFIKAFRLIIEEFKSKFNYQFKTTFRNRST